MSGGLSLQGSGLTLTESSGSGSASNGFPITSGQSGVVSSGGEILVLSGGLVVINAGGSETISGTETIASGGALIVAAGGSETVSGTETIASGGLLVVAAGGSQTVSGTETIASGGALVVASGATETIVSGGQLVISSGAVISSGTAQTLLNAEGVAGLDPITPGGFVAGRWYGPPYTRGQSSNINAASGTIYATLFYVPYVTSFSALGSWINTSTTANLLWGVYGPITPTQMAASLSGTPKVGQTTSTAIAGTSASISAAFTSALQPGWHAGVIMGDAAFSAGNAGGGGLAAWAAYIFGDATPVPGNTFSAGFTVAGTVFANGLPATLPTMTATVAGSLVAVSWLK